MEPFPKRQRIYAPHEDIYDHQYDDDLGYYETGDTELEEDDGEETEEQIYDPEEDFEQKRAQLDYKLKSTFEGIFEKYGKNFDGVGDEIDLETGEIVVNNGHLLEMHDERDVGEVRARKARGHIIDVPQQEDTSSSEDELCYEDEDGDEQDEMEEGEGIDYDNHEEEEDDALDYSDNEMLEDDLILRQSFALASSHLQRPQRKKSIPDSWEWDQKGSRSRPDAQGANPPLKSQIMNQFGPQLGPRIADYILKKREEEQNHIEPAWRVPELPTGSRRRQGSKAFVAPMRVERPPSPEGATSLWAPVRTRKQKSKSAYHMNSTAKAHKAMQESRYNTESPDLIDIRPLTALDRPALHRKGVRNRFTDEEDDTLLDFVADAKSRGLALRSRETWRMLAEMYPSHSSISWMDHYHRKFTYLDDNNIGGSELSTSETSDDIAMNQNRGNPARGYDLGIEDPDPILMVYPQPLHRSSRIRKPAPRDSGVMSWSEAANTIESVDPVLHGAILEDVRAAANGGHDGNIGSKSNGRFGRPQERAGKLRQEPEIHRYQDTSRTSTSHFSRLPGKDSGVSAHLVHHSSKTQSVQELMPQAAPCPHIDCRMRSEALYLLNRRDGEEESEMWRHLGRVHHTTPFSCGETDCERKGERGYFSQVDLVSHIKSAHPSISALQRPRGRVDQELLGFREDPAPRRHPASPHRSTEAFRRHSVPVSPELDTRQIPPSSEISSSTPDHDLTLTPGGFSSRIGPSSTPKTSVSLLNGDTTTSPENAAKEPGELNRHLRGSSLVDHDRRSYAEIVNSASNAMQVPQHGSEFASGKKAILTAPTSVAHAEEPSEQSQHIVLEPTVHTQHANVLTPPSIERRYKITLGSRRVPTSRTSVPETPLASTIPNSQSSLAVLPSSSPLLPRSAISESRDARNPENSMPLERNMVDPSYEFSDEEVINETTQKLAEILANTLVKTPAREPAQQTAKDPATSKPTPPVTELQNKVSTSSSKLQSITPAMRRKLQKRLRKSLDSEDVDELSLGTADFILLSCRPRSKKIPWLSETPRIKDEPLGTPVRSFKLQIRKRKFSMLQDKDEFDELATQGVVDLLKTPAAMFHNHGTNITSKTVSSSSPSSHGTKKDEVAMPRPTNEKAVRAPKPNHVVQLSAESSVAAAQDPHAPKFGNKQKRPAPSTPILKPTPEANRKKDSYISRLTKEPTMRVSKSSAAPKQRVGLPTPPATSAVVGPQGRSVRKGAETDVLIKTPGGTLRRCGEDGFSCGRSFCFKCSGH